MTCEILENDEIARLLIYNRFFPGNIHTNTSLWMFEHKNKDGSYEESALLRRKTPHDLDVHKRGCDIAEKQNIKKGFARGHDKRRYYCAFRNAKVSDIPLEGEEYSIELLNDHDDHVAVKVLIKASDKGRHRVIVSDLGLKLAEVFSPLSFHRCECDKDDANHPVEKFGQIRLSGDAGMI